MLLFLLRNCLLSRFCHIYSAAESSLGPVQDWLKTRVGPIKDQTAAQSFSVLSWSWSWSFTFSRSWGLAETGQDRSQPILSCKSLLQSRYGLPHYAYLTRRTSHFFMPTIFVTHLMLDSYGQPHFLTYTVPCPLPLFYIWFLPYYEYGTIPCSLIRTFPCTYMYINPCT